MSIAIKIENLSKQYRLGLVSTRTLSHDLNRWWQTSILGREDPYLKIGEENKLSVRRTPHAAHRMPDDYVWALKDINLEVEEGEVLGIIGKNGAGKSTLLKILSKVTSPTTGTIKARGRIASLLEVGTGFHQEMTGRENIYLNGAILGMTKAEINKKLDEIIDFAGVERYIDTPVKRYSSGMMVRLGFAVAAHLDPEILVVDEVLAVGDAEFQKKAIGKMQDVSRQKGRTVLFVSHNMATVKELCQIGVLLNEGRIDFVSTADKTIEKYLNKSTGSKYSHWERGTDSTSEIYFNYVAICDKHNVITENVGSGEKFKIIIRINSRIKTADTIIAVQFNDAYGNPVFTTSNSDYSNQLEEIEVGQHSFSVNISNNILMPGIYYLIIACFESGKKLYDIIENELSIRIEDLGIRLYNRHSRGVVHENYQWVKNETEVL